MAYPGKYRHRYIQTLCTYFCVWFELSIWILITFYAWSFIPGDGEAWTWRSHITVRSQCGPCPVQALLLSRPNCPKCKNLHSSDTFEWQTYESNAPKYDPSPVQALLLLPLHPKVQKLAQFRHIWPHACYAWQTYDSAHNFTVITLNVQILHCPDTFDSKANN